MVHVCENRKLFIGVLPNIYYININKKMRGFSFVLYLILAILVAAFAAANMIGINTGYGHTTDTVHSIEYSGLVCKTWKVWLTNDHPVGSDSNGLGGSDAIYSVAKNNTAVLTVLQDSYASGKKVKLEYHTLLFATGCIHGLHSGYAVVDRAELVE